MNLDNYLESVATLYPDFLGYINSFPDRVSYADLIRQLMFPAEGERAISVLVLLLAGYTLETADPHREGDPDAPLMLLVLLAFLFGCWLGQRGGSLRPLEPAR